MNFIRYSYVSNMKKIFEVIIFIVAAFILYGCGLNSYPGVEKIESDFLSVFNPVTITENINKQILLDNMSVDVIKEVEYENYLEVYYNVRFSGGEYSTTGSYMSIYNLSKNSGWIFDEIKIVEDIRVIKFPELDNIEVDFEGMLNDISNRDMVGYDKIELVSKFLNEDLQNVIYTYNGYKSTKYITENVSFEIAYKPRRLDSSNFRWELVYNPINMISQEIYYNKEELVGEYDGVDEVGWETHLIIEDVKDQRIYLGTDSYFGNPDGIFNRINLSESPGSRYNIIEYKSKITKDNTKGTYNFSMKYKYADHGKVTEVTFSIHDDYIEWAQRLGAPIKLVKK